MTDEREPAGAEDPIRLLAALAPVALLALASVAGAPVRILEPLAAAWLALVFAAALRRSARSGLMLLLLVSPLFLGESYRTWFWLFDLFAVSTALRGLAELRGRRPHLPAALPLLAFVAVAVAAFPLDGAAFRDELRFSTVPELLRALVTARLAENLNYVRFLCWALLGSALLAVAAGAEWTESLFRRLAVAATGMLVAVSTAGFLTSSIWHREGRPFLSMWLGGLPGGGRLVASAGTAWNTGWFCHWVLAFLPASAFLVLDGRSRRERAVGISGLVVGSTAILLSYQRSGYLAWALEVALFLVVVRRRARLPREAGAHSPAPSRRVFAAGAAAAIVVAGLLAVSPVGDAVRYRFRSASLVSDAERLVLLEAAGRMALDHPWLGVGSGRFARELPRYTDEPSMEAGYWSAHSLLPQVAAEQGALGLLAFLVLGFALFRRPLASFRRSGSPAVGLLLVAAAGVFACGHLNNHPLLVPAMLASAAICVGILASQTGAPEAPRARGPRRIAALAIGLLAFALLAVRISRSSADGRDYVRGLHEPERIGQARWTDPSALLLGTVEGRTLRLPVSFPAAARLGHAQPLTVLVDGRRILELSISSPVFVDVTAGRPTGARIAVGLVSGTTLIPFEEGLGSDSRRLGIRLGPPGWLR